MKHQCNCNQEGEQARIRLLDDQEIATGLLRLPCVDRDGMFWPQPPGDMPDYLYTMQPQEVVAEVLSDAPHTHTLR
jgi:hypothetical protein